MIKFMSTIRNERPTLVIAYNIIIGVLAIVSVILAIRSLFIDPSLIEYWIDIIVWIIFVLDYMCRLALADNKKRFFARNIIDLIAIIPFYSVLKFFRIGRLVRVIRLLRLLKVVRAGVRVGRFIKQSRRFLNTNGFKFMLLAIVGMIFLSALLMMVAEDMRFWDGLWWSFVTVTTVGYGDIAPASAGGRILAVVLMLFGIGLIGSLTSTVTAYFLREKKESENEFVAAAIQKLQHFDDLTEKDVEEIATVLIALKKTDKGGLLHSSEAI